MILKLRLDTDQLAALHKVLRDENNFQKYTYTTTVPDDICPGEKKHQGREAFVFVKSCKAQGGGESNPVPSYDVALEVEETYMELRYDGRQDPSKLEKTPLDRLEAVFNAIGLFPRTPPEISLDALKVVETEAHDIMTSVHEPHRVPDYTNQEYRVVVHMEGSMWSCLMRIVNKENVGQTSERWRGYLIGNKENNRYLDTINFIARWNCTTKRGRVVEMDEQDVKLLRRLMNQY